MVDCLREYLVVPPSENKVREHTHHRAVERCAEDRHVAIHTPHAMLRSSYLVWCQTPANKTVKINIAWTENDFQVWEHSSCGALWIRCHIPCHVTVLLPGGAENDFQLDIADAGNRTIYKVYIRIT